MFDPVFECLQKATESTIRVQQEVFKKWVGAWPGFGAASPLGNDRVAQFQQRWAETVGDLIKKQQEALDEQFRAGVANIEEAFKLTQAKDFDQLRAKTVELWQKTFDSLRQAHEAQLRALQGATARWTELMMKEAASCWAAT